ncbi:MAG: NAD(P)-dependent oxidoreductase [Steroidobacteraceae bacterium]
MRTGFIGLGAMGAPMARNLQRAGLLHSFWNRTAGKAQALSAELGIAAATSPVELARDCDALVLCVSADQDLLALIAAIAPALREPLLIIDCSTVSANAARAAGRICAARGADFLDAPVSGGVEGAVQGTLVMMVGGEASAFERAQPLLRAMGKAATHFGPQGAGQIAKATNQIMVAGIIRAVAQALAFAAAQGLALDQTIATLSQGAGGSWYLANRGPFMQRGAYPAGFRVRLHEKDLKICRSMAAAMGAELSVVEDTLRDYARLIADGHGDEDISAVYRLATPLFTTTTAPT